jgi:hypothetical protein
MNLPENFDEIPEELFDLIRQKMVESAPPPIRPTVAKTVEALARAKKLGTDRKSRAWEPEPFTDEDLAAMEELFSLMIELIVVSEAECENPFHDHSTGAGCEASKQARKELTHEFRMIGGPALVAILKELQELRVQVALYKLADKFGELVEVPLPE